MDRSLQRKSVLLTLLVSGLLIAGGTTSVADPRGKGTTRFAGSCSMKGTVNFDPGATFITQALRYEFNGEGACTGTLNGSDVKDVTVRVDQYGKAEGSCASAHTTEPGHGELTFPDGSVLSYTLEFAYEVPETNFTFSGSKSGEAHGKGTFRTDRTPPDTTARCATPEGVTEIPMDMTLSTDSPLVSRKR